MEGAAQTILVNVGQLVGQEFRQLRAVGGEIAELKDELATMNTLIRMQSEADDSGLNHFVREWMKQLRELAYDGEDCVDLYLFRIRRRMGDGLLLWSKRLLATLFPRHRLAGEIAALRVRAVTISERHARYGVNLELLSRRTASSDPVRVQAMVASTRAVRADNDSSQLLVGIQAQADDLANKIKGKEGEEEKELKVFSIVGFGGLGKTTLAMEVCRQLQTVFQHQAKVSVSETFGRKDLQGLLKRVLRQIASLQANKASDQADVLGKIDSMDVAELEHKLSEILQKNRYLILIDDVWSKAAWDAIRSKLPSNNCGSRIIVTTRIDTVAKACSNTCDDYIHRMKKLDGKEASQLFLRKSVGSDSCPPGLQGAMKNILKKCGGLPLAIVSIASLLASYKLPEGNKMWEIVGRSIGSQMNINPTLEGIRQILTLSYEHLPHHLKGCMMYLSIFPEDYMICKDRLLKRWIAEGLIPVKRGMTQMELAEDYFNELMSRSIIDRAADIVTGYQWREETCQVHDMMLEAMVSKSLESNFVSLIGGQYEGMSYDKIRRLTIHGGLEAPQDTSSKKMVARRGTRNGINAVNVQHVRSLSIFDPEAHKLLARLGEFTLLRVLDLEDCKGLEEKYMKHICRMYLLRFLSLKNSDIKVMPSRIGDLEHLQTLDVRQTQLTSLPETITKLEKLEHLLFTTKSNLWSGWMLPQGIKKMKALRHMNKVVVISDEKVAKEIGELDQLKELCIYVDSRKEIHPDVPEGLACSLSKIYSLEWLDIGNFGCDQWPFKEVLGFLHDVEPPPRLLRYLRICGCINKLPDWVGSLKNLIEFDLEWTYLCVVELFDDLCKLPNLQRLTLGPYFCDDEEMVFGVQEIEEMFYLEPESEEMGFSEPEREEMVFGEQEIEEMIYLEPESEEMGFSEPEREEMVESHVKSFRKLTELTLGYAPEIPKVYKFKIGSMPELETLVLNFGDQWKTIVGIEHLINLKEVQISCVIEGALVAALELLKVENKNRLKSSREEIRVIVR